MRYMLSTLVITKHKHVRFLSLTFSLSPSLFSVFFSVFFTLFVAVTCKMLLNMPVFVVLLLCYAAMLCSVDVDVTATLYVREHMAGTAHKSKNGIHCQEAKRERTIFCFGVSTRLCMHFLLCLSIVSFASLSRTFTVTTHIHRHIAPIHHRI